MKNLPLLLASLVTSSLSFAQGTTPAPTPPTPPPAPRNMRQACLPQGDVLFEVGQRAEAWTAGRSAKLPTWTTTLYATGGFTHVEVDGAGKITRSTGGCLDGKQLDIVRRDLAHAPLIVKHAEVACDAISATFVQYSSHGKALWAEHMCSLDYIDDASRKALAEITQLLADATQPATPPCCKK